MIGGWAGCDLDAYAGIRGAGAGEKGRDRGQEMARHSTRDRFASL